MSEEEFEDDKYDSSDNGRKNKVLRLSDSAPNKGATAGSGGAATGGGILNIGSGSGTST